MKILKKLIIIIPIVLVLALGLHIASNYLFHNFHAVIPGKIYRSAQLSPTALNHYVRKYQIKTIINLRGKNLGDRWYLDEMSFVAQHEVRHFDVKLSAYQLPTDKQLARIVYLLQHAPKPILIHCRSGVDRSGLAASISVILANDPSLGDVKHQISWWYNVIHPTTVGYQVITNYLHWLQVRHLSYSKSSFLKWLSSAPKLQPYSGWFIIWGF